MKLIDLQRETLCMSTPGSACGEGSTGAGTTTRTVVRARVVLE